MSLPPRRLPDLSRLQGRTRRCEPTRPVVRAAARAVTAAGAAAALLAGCSGGSSPEPAPAPTTASASPTVSSTVAVPDEVTLTEQGSALPFGTTARVIFEATQGRGTVLGINVLGVRRGRPSDFGGFILDDPLKRGASYYYARVRVRNAGRGDVGGVGVPLRGVDRSNTLLPAVNFTSPFPPCRTRPLPASFPPGAVLDTCLVFMVAKKGPLVSVSYRPSQAFDPVTWKGVVAAPEPDPKATGKPATKATKKRADRSTGKSTAKP